MSHPPASSTSVAILAGGKSRRMGSNKLLKHLSGKTLLRLTYELARSTELPVQIIRRDIIPPCGPLSGIITAFRQTHSDRILFLAGDMPHVTPQHLQELLAQSQDGSPAFSYNGKHIGFPFILTRKQLPIVESQLEQKQRSLQRLFTKCPTRTLLQPKNAQTQLHNINTPEDLIAHGKTQKA